MRGFASGVEGSHVAFDSTSTEASERVTSSARTTPTVDCRLGPFAGLLAAAVC